MSELSPILKKVREVDPNNSDAIKDVLSTFFQNLSKHTVTDCITWLRLLENVVNRFPKFCVSQRNTIETYLAHFLDCSNYSIVVEAAKCAHALQQVRPPQLKATTAKSNWRDQMNIVCRAAHSLLGAVFPRAVDIHGDESENETSCSSPLSDALTHIKKVNTKALTGGLTKRTLFATRLRNVFLFMQAMLVEVYPVAKPIRPQTILDVIVRALSVSSGTSGEQDMSKVLIAKMEALRCLDALIACLGPNLIPFSPLVFRFVMQTLKWSSENPGEESSKIRCSAYNSLSRWLSVLRVHRAETERGRSWEDDITGHVLADVTPQKRLIQLSMGTQPTKHLSKKAKRKLANTMLKESTISAHMPGEKNKITENEEVNEEVAIAALECAEIFLTACGIFLKPTTHKRFQELLVRECYSLDAYTCDRAIAMLRVLDASRKSATPTVPPPTQYCLHLYSSMVNSDHREISRFCSQALLDIRLHLHCSPPSLNFAVEIRQEKTGESKKNISERNRAALESLLGVDKVPKQNIEEVITIADGDEPDSKRARIEEESDKISLSSESINSVASVVDSDEEQQDLEDLIEEVQEIAETCMKDNEDSVEVDENEIVDNSDRIASPNISGEVIAQEKVDSTIVETHNNEETKTNDEKQTDIHSATTQMPNNVEDTIEEEERPLSMEVSYDYPNTGNEKVTVLERMDEENLPSSTETDDVQITCGQDLKSSQDSEKQPDSNEVPKSNGVSCEKVVVNGDKCNDNINEDITKKVTVEDMLADFVDEVNQNA